MDEWERWDTEPSEEDLAQATRTLAVLAGLDAAEAVRMLARVHMDIRLMRAGDRRSGRYCLGCGAPISESMGSVLSSDIVEALDGLRPWGRIREVCSACSLKFEGGVIAIRERDAVRVRLEKLASEIATLKAGTES